MPVATPEAMPEAMCPVATLSVRVAPPIPIGRVPGGLRRVVPILGGTVSGEGWTGEILAGGADYQLVRDDGVTELEARYAFRTSAGATVYVVNHGIRHASPEDMARLLRGEAVPPERVYFRCTPRFETEAPDLAFLTRNVFVGYGERYPDEVRLRVLAV